MCALVELRLLGGEDLRIVIPTGPTHRAACLVSLALEWSPLCEPCLELCDLPLQLLHHCLVAGHVVVHRQHIADHLYTPGGEEGEGDCRVTS